MSDSLVILGEEYTNVAGIKATATGGGTLTYIRPDGSKSITENGTNIDVAAYATVNVNVSVSPNLQSKTYTPNDSETDVTISPDSGYDGLSSVVVDGIDPLFVGSGIDKLYSSDVEFEEAERIVYGGVGYYPSGFDYEVPAQTLPTAASSTSSGTTKATIGRSTSDQYINIPKGYNTALANYKVSAVPNGTVTPASTISGTNADVDRDGTTLYLSKTVSNTPQVTTAGYVSSGTAGNSVIELTATDSNWTAANIKKNVSIFGITGTYAGAAPNLQAKTNIAPTTSSQTITADSGYDGLSSVQINAMPSMTLPTAASGTSSGTRKAIIASSTSTQYINIPTGYNSAAAYYQLSAPTAMTLPTTTSSTSSGTSKLAVTPNTANKYINIPTGYNSAAAYYTVNGDANLVAGNIKNGTTIFGVTGSYEGGGGTSKNAQTAQSTTRSTSTSGTSVISLTCTKTGTYDVYWTTFRSSTSGTWGSRLYIGGTAYETMQTGSWSNHIQNRHVSNVSISANQTVAVYVQSRGSNYYGYVGTLTIIES